MLGSDCFALGRAILGSSPRDPRIKALENAARQPRALVDFLLTITGRSDIPRTLIDPGNQPGTAA